MPESDPVIERALAEASGPGLAPGAAGRIADGAWRRAAELRASRTPRFRVFGRLGFLTAAAAAIVGALVVFRRSEAAFAVEGDPVMVRRGGGWTSSLRVAADEHARAWMRLNARFPSGVPGDVTTRAEMETMRARLAEARDAAIRELEAQLDALLK